MSNPIEPALKAARQLLAQRRAQDAYELCRRLLADHPDHPGALTLAGAALSAAGRFEPALEHLRRAVELEPGRVEAELELALALRQSGRLDEALERLQRTALSHPDDVAVLNTHGLLLSGAGEHRPAARALKRAWRLSSEHPGIGFNLGEAQRKGAELAAAAATFEAILGRHPGHAPSLNSLGLVRLAERQFEAAARHFQAALERQPGDLRFAANLASALERGGRIDAAVEVLKTALERAPRAVELILQLARLYREVDEFEAARTAYGKALEADPTRIEAWRELAWLEEQANRGEAAAEAAARGLALRPEDPGLRLLQARRARRQGDLETARERLGGLDEERLDPVQRSAWEREWGHLHDAMEQPDAAWRHFLQAARRLDETAAGAGHDPDRYPKLAARWGRALAKMTAPAAAPVTDSPVFVVGFPRSGTTLLDQFLGGHPGLATMEEKPALDAVIARADELELSLPGGLDALGAEQIAALKQRYQDAVRSFINVADERRLVDRLPVNVVYLPLIQALWPGAPVVFVARDPLDACLSCLMQDFRLNPLTWHLADPDRCVSLYRTFADLWLEFERRAPALGHVVRYEDLINAPERTCRALVEHLGLAWDPAMLDHVATAKARAALRTASYHQVVKPLYREALGRWRRYRRQLEPWLEALSPYREHFGYDQDPGP